MSLSKTGLRRITVNNQTYEWTIRPRKTSGENYSIKKLIAAIQIADKSERGVLLVDFGVSPPNSETNPHKTAVTPKTIESVILNALDEGWNPFKSGTFQLKYPLEFIPDPNSPFPGHSNYDTRWSPEYWESLEKPE